MVTFVLILCLFLITVIVGYKYYSPNQWVNIRKKLKDNNILPKEKAKIKKMIYKKYKYRTLIKAKKFKSLNKQMTSNISVKQLGYYALDGLADSINNFDPSNRMNFARFSDKFIDDKLKSGAFSIKNVNKSIEWAEPYWTCINNELSPAAKKIITLKFSKSFDKIRTNSEISKISNISEAEVNKIIIDSLDFIRKKIKFNNSIGYELFIDRT